MESCFVQIGDDIFFHSIREIAPGDELLFSFAPEYQRRLANENVDEEGEELELIKEGRVVSDG